MLTSVQLRNFKCIVDSGPLRLSPITVFAGANSSGKTSVIQAVLLVKQTVEARDYTVPLLVNGPYVQLGSYTSFVFRHRPDLKLGIEVEFSAPAQRKASTRPVVSSHIRVSATFSYDKQRDLIILEESTVTRGGKSSGSVAISRTSDRQYIASIRFDTHSISLKGSPYKFFDLIPDRQELAKLRELPYPVFAARWELELLAREIVYIGPLREFPRRVYVASGRSPEDVGLRGELAAEVLWSSVQRQTEVLRRVKKAVDSLGIAKDVELKKWHALITTRYSSKILTRAST